MNLKALPTVTKTETVFPENPSNGDLLVWNWVDIPFMDGSGGAPVIYHYAVDSVEEAVKVIDHLATEQLKDSSISGNAFGLVQCNLNLGAACFSTSELKELVWEEWESDDGDDIDVIMQG